MSSAMDYAKYFLKRGLDSDRDTYDGNMKLQKLLFFADYIYLVTNGEPLFPEPIRAFTNGCVVEEVRTRYRYDLSTLCRDSVAFNPNFTPQEYDVLNKTIDIFGRLSARELSELNHSFSFWRTAYDRSKDEYGYKDKDKAIVTNEEMLAEVDRITLLLETYENNKIPRMFKELVNGVEFYYDPELKLTEELLEQLLEFTKYAEDDAYSVYLEEGNLVIY